MTIPGWLMEKVYSSLKLSDEYRELLNKRIDGLALLAQKAREEGLLSLEDRIEEQDHALLKLGLLLVCDGYEPDEIRQTLLNGIAAEQQEAPEILQGLIIADGVLGIQAGLNPDFLKVRMAAYMGVNEALAKAQ